MLQKLITILKQPHPGYASLLDYFKTVGAITLVVFLILSVLQPFNIGQHHIYNNSYVTALIYGSGAAGVMSINAIWLLLFPAWFKNWTLGKDFIILFYQMATVGLAIWLININNPSYSKQDYSKAIFITFAIGILPYVIVTFFKHSRYLKNSLLQAELMNSQLEALHKATLTTKNSEPEELYVVMPAGKSLKIRVQRFLYAESKGNNLHLQWLEHEYPKTEIIRCTLNEFAKANVAHLCFFRCHRSYIVNIDRILEIRGNAAGYQLLLHSDLNTVAVSRSYVNLFKKRLGKNK